MVEVGQAAWGLTISTAQSAGAPSGDQYHFFSNYFQWELVTNDRTNHLPNQVSNTVVLGQIYWRVTVKDALIAEQNMATLNTYTKKFQAFSRVGSSAVYFWAKDRAGTYFNFTVGTTDYNYLLCRIKKPSGVLTNKKYLMSFQVEESLT